MSGWVDNNGAEFTGPIPELCPMCDARVSHGFGLMGGGYGPYAACWSDEEDHACPWYVKRRIPAGEEE